MARALGVQSPKFGKQQRGRFPRSWRQARQWKTHISVFYVCFSATAVQPRSHGTTLVSSFPRSYSHEHLLMRVWTYLCMCALRVRTCARACGSACVCAGTCKSFIWYGHFVLALTRKCKHSLILIYIPQRSVHSRPVACHREAHRQLEHK